MRLSYSKKARLGDTTRAYAILIVNLRSLIGSSLIDS
jgi:hypothetical protein